MFTKKLFLEVFVSHDDFDNERPRTFVIDMSQDMAKEYLRRIELVRTIEKVDHSIHHITFKDVRGTYYRDDTGPSGEEINPNSQMPQEILLGRRVMIRKDRICFECDIFKTPVEAQTMFLLRQTLIEISEAHDPDDVAAQHTPEIEMEEEPQ